MSDATTKTVAKGLVGAALAPASLPAVVVDGLVKLAREGARLSKEEREAASKQVLSSLTQGPGIPRELADAFSVVWERSEKSAKEGVVQIVKALPADVAAEFLSEWLEVEIAIRAARAAALLENERLWNDAFRQIWLMWMMNQIVNQPPPPTFFERLLGRLVRVGSARAQKKRPKPLHQRGDSQESSGSGRSTAEADQIEPCATPSRLRR